MLCDAIPWQSVPRAPISGAAPIQTTLSYQQPSRDAHQSAPPGSAARPSPTAAVLIPAQLPVCTVGPFSPNLNWTLPPVSPPTDSRTSRGAGSKALLSRVARVGSRAGPLRSATSRSPRRPVPLPVLGAAPHRKSAPCCCAAHSPTPSTTEPLDALRCGEAYHPSEWHNLSGVTHGLRRQSSEPTFPKATIGETPRALMTHGRSCLWIFWVTRTNPAPRFRWDDRVFPGEVPPHFPLKPAVKPSKWFA